MKKRIFTAMLALLMLASSCGKGGSDTETSGSISDSESTSVTESDNGEKLGLPEGLNYGGYTFRILSRPERVAEIESDDTSDVLSDAVYKRNRKVEELLGVKFEVFKSSCDWENDALTPILSGEDAYDAIAAHAQFAFNYGLEGAALDWLKVDNLDLTKSWWNQDAIENFTIAGKLYQADGSISYAALSQTDCMVFNKKLLDDYGFEYPYDIVDSGKWTFDRFEEMVKAVGSDLNSDGSRKIEDDLFGYATSRWIGPVEILISAGVRVVTIDDEGYPQLTLYNDRSVEVMDRYTSLIRSDNAFVQKDDQPHYRQAFSDGRVAFIDTNPSGLANLRETTVDFGVVPWPKYDEAVDKYYSNVDAGHSLWVIPKTVKDVSRTGAVLEAMAYYGKQLIIPAYYDMTLQSKLLRDERSIDMLDYIYDGAAYDVGYYKLGGELDTAGRQVAESNTLTLTTLYAKKSEQVKATIAERMEKYNSND